MDYHTFRAQVVPQYRCGGLLAMPSGRYPYPRPCTASRCCFDHGDASRRQQTRGYLWIASSSRHVDTPFKDVRSPPALSDTVVRETQSLVITKIFDFRTTSLRGRTGRLRRTVRNPLRSDRFLSVDTAACHLNAPVENSGLAFERWPMPPNDGAYPRPEGRGIAPVPLIRSDIGVSIVFAIGTATALS